MMKIKIISLGRLKEKFFIEAAMEYEKRLKRYADLSTEEIEPLPLPENPSDSQIEAALEKEAKKIEKKITGKKVYALCVEGEQVSSVEFADMLKKDENGGTEIAFLIGSSYELSKSIKQKAAKRISFSKMTFPHRLFRVMLLEQIYRAFKINEGSKYHK